MIYCAECENPIAGNWCLYAISRYWHEECLRCVCCECRLVDQQNDHFFFRDGLCLCAWHYVRLFGRGGVCHLCAGQIGSSEWVLSVCRGHTYEKCVFHLQCFACAECNGRFCVGDPFIFSADGMIFCKGHFQQKEEQQQMNPNK
ncbi:hypothetical protein niasHS_013444 [Heterodera schachtii]|uniref:LIM zinc-binding domain-containing protein n=1 Tax=Heterodera schachtii TaxID=97005 RepID=A0ABD2IJ88_HETSC